MKRNTKELILQKGAEIVRLKGFHHSGIQEILNSAGVPKGSFYFYFKSKEDFGLQLIDYYSNFFLGNADVFIKDENFSYLDRLRRFFEFFLNYFETTNYMGGCSIGNLAQELGDINVRFRVKLNEVFEKMKTKVETFLRYARDENEISEEIDIKKVSDFIINSWEGALLRTKVTKSSEPLRIFEKFIFEQYLGKSIVPFSPGKDQQQIA
ncbi:TetR family transcriptional regulator C-terminal domain-containing protein [candidate division KSB1 bacterium]|nr:TetR family transcriptional regulator C-terminal domain-containing protein [candidate division KSB1 bacterium]